MDAVDEVKQRLSIEDVISEYVQLKRAGRNWKGLSPFTNEKTPSFTVSPEKQIWHDFSSGKGGDMFSFVMAMEGLDFKQTLELLARKAGVDLDQYRTKGSGRGPNKEKLYEILELATKFYQTQFGSSQLALQYVFKKREFTKETALTWRLGYAPNTGRALTDFLRGKGYKDSDIKLAGLTNRFGGDLFRERLMIPLADAQGRIVGFTARQLADEPDSPKYINTSATPLYDKSRHVFGLHLAKESIRKSKFVVLAEGNLDVIMSHQAGVKQVVATAGTALTEQHLKALSRFTGDIRLCFDADNAGLNATERAIPIASRTKVSLSIISIPSGKDPDELIKQDVGVWQEIIQKPQYALDWLMERYQNVLDVTTAEGKRKYSDVLLPVVKGLTDAVEQDHYIVTIGKVTGVSREALITKMEHGSDQVQTRPLKRRKVDVEPESPVDTTYLKNIDNFLSLMLLQPKVRDYLPLVPLAAYPDGPPRELAEFLQNNSDFGTKNQSPAEMAALLAQATSAGLQTLHSSAMQGADEQRTEPYLAYGEGAAQAATPQRAETGDRGTGSARAAGAGVHDLQQYVKILGLQYEEIYEGVDPIDLSRAAATLQQKVIKAYVTRRKQEIQRIINDADEQQQRSLQLEDAELNRLLHRSKGA